MADDMPPNTEWVLVKHQRVPVAKDDIIGHFPTSDDAVAALNAVLQNPQWFCSYSVEHRNKA